MDKKRNKRKNKQENSSLVARVMEITPLKIIDSRKEITELRVLEESPTKKGDEYYLILNSPDNENEHGLIKNELYVFDVDFREPVYDFGNRKHYNIKDNGYKRIGYL